jgi:hypothetical protein
MASKVRMQGEIASASQSEWPEASGRDGPAVPRAVGGMLAQSRPTEPDHVNVVAYKSLIPSVTSSRESGEAAQDESICMGSYGKRGRNSA